MYKHHILLIDDDADLTRLISKYLSSNGFCVEVLNTGEGAVESILFTQADLVILDLMLPGENGLNICRKVRESFAKPILMLTALGDDIDEVTGLEVGADDYVSKPVSPRVLLAHVRALLRRHEREKDQTPDNSGEIMIGQLFINKCKREAFVSGQVLNLTTTEFDLLYYFALHRGQELTRDRLYSVLYKFEYDGQDRTLDLTVSRLRKKLRDSGHSPDTIKTLRGRGYLLT